MSCLVDVNIKTDKDLTLNINSQAEPSLNHMTVLAWAEFGYKQSGIRTAQIKIYFFFSNIKRLKPLLSSVWVRCKSRLFSRWSPEARKISRADFDRQDFFSLLQTSAEFAHRDSGIFRVSLPPLLKSTKVFVGYS